MRFFRCAIALIVAGVGGSLALTTARVAPAPAVAATAPGRVVFSVDGGAVDNDDQGGAASAAVALADGGAVLVGNGGAPGGSGAYAAEIEADGSVSAAFGSGGIAALPSFVVDQVVLEPDGGFVVAGQGTSTASGTLR